MLAVADALGVSSTPARDALDPRSPPKVRLTIPAQKKVTVPYLTMEASEETTAHAQSSGGRAVKTAMRKLFGPHLRTISATVIGA
ncbi:hypothetical protein [Mesorhizobium sp.]|uniref:hypothetical protein n=1 Tax=Mesorhizobium sp. TaxID=1871066 RepID=UPI000FE873A5|nr:hypothetical protein [Mesorhizobium sp.]RWP30327.1 MAG: hypothetical protein EOR02_13205 [Mesorhizobium sp.]